MPHLSSRRDWHRVALLTLVIGCIAAPWALAQDNAEAEALDSLIAHAELAAPTPATPYYHYHLKLDLPEASNLDAEVFIDGEKQRFVTMKNKEPDPNLPVIHYRPAFANTYTVDLHTYDDPHVTGWLAWQPGQEYEIKIQLRMRKGLETSDEDRIITDTVKVTAPDDAEVFDPAWQDFKAVVLSETEGIDREGEPVEVVLAFYADQAQNLTNSLRVVAVDPKTKAITEVPSQAYDIRHDVLEEDPRPPNDAGQRRAVPVWVPTITARIAFLADVSAKSSKVYLVYHNNPSAEAAEYDTGLKASGPTPGIQFDAENNLVEKERFRIENNEILIDLHPLAGVIDEMTLKAKPEQKLFHHMETNGAMHWAPEAYPPPRPWSHMSDWKEPDFNVIKGPVVVQTHAHAAMPYVPEVDASVTYRVYPGKPYVITETSSRVNAALAVQAMRNGEMIARRDLISHLSWYDSVRGGVQTVNLDELADLNEVLMDVDVPWITFYNPKTGIALGGIQLGYANGGLEHRPRVVNPYYYVIVGPVVYWSRAMNFTFASSASQLMIEVPEGSFFWERWAFVMYEPAKGDKPWAPLLDWQKQLTHPLRVRLVEEVESRVPTVGTEIYIDPSKTGWEDRETLKKE